MPKTKVLSTRRKTTRLKPQTTAEFAKSLKLYRFAGVALGGGKTDRTVVAVIEYYPEHKKVFLRRIHEKIKAEGEVSADQKLYEILAAEAAELESITFDTPLQLPKCLRCHLTCPGYESCQEPEIRWMWKIHGERARTKRPLKIFTPYTERCSELYISTQLEEAFHPSHALGANLAPLTARALFLQRRLKVPCFEAFARLSLWRMGRALRIPKSHLRYHRHSVEGDESRLYILRTLVEKEIAFLYQQDIRLMVENWYAFEAFLCALTGFLRYQGQCEKKPKDFPKDEAWIEFPKEHIDWFA